MPSAGAVTGVANSVPAEHPLNGLPLSIDIRYPISWSRTFLCALFDN